jgi:hypothetical protein
LSTAGRLLPTGCPQNDHQVQGCMVAVGTSTGAAGDEGKVIGG